MPKGEPTTEDEAQEMKSFLERGAPVSLESVRRLPAIPGRLLANQPASLAIPDAAAILDQVEEPAADADRVSENRLVIELEFAPPRVLPNYSVHVFVNNPSASVRTPPTDPSFVGSVAFLCHAELENGEPVCVHANEDPIVFRLPVRDDVVRSAGRAPLVVSLVPVPYEGRRPIDPLDVKATVELVRSEYTKVS